MSRQLKITQLEIERAVENMSKKIEQRSNKVKPERNITRADKTDKAAINNRKPIEPLNDKQKDYLTALADPSVHTIICIGVLGSSKTYLPSTYASDLLIDKKIDRIIIARPAESSGKTLGFSKGTDIEKLEAWCAPVTDNIKKRIGWGNYEAFLANGKIMLLPLEKIKGRSWDNAFILVDEVEDIEADVAKSLVTRMGENTKVCLTGDLAQQDLLEHSGLQYVLDVAEYAKLDYTLIDFDDWKYCVRSEAAKKWGMAFEKFDKDHENSPSKRNRRR